MTQTIHVLLSATSKLLLLYFHEVEFNTRNCLKKGRKKWHSSQGQPRKVLIWMPKIRALLGHTCSFIRKLRYWVLFSEQGFQHFPLTCARIRKSHAANISLGSATWVDKHSLGRCALLKLQVLHDLLRKGRRNEEGSETGSI